METPQLFESLIRVGSSGSSRQYLELSKVYFTCCSVYYITGEFILQSGRTLSFCGWYIVQYFYYLVMMLMKGTDHHQILVLRW